MRKGRRRYRTRPGHQIVAVQLKLDTPGFTYRKWGAKQRCKRGDWLVDNQGEVYTVDARVFARTYRAAGGGSYQKVTKIWAEVATRSGSVATKEGRSHYRAGDYLVFNDKNGGDAYCMGRRKFKATYIPDD